MEFYILFVDNLGTRRWCIEEDTSEDVIRKRWEDVMSTSKIIAIFVRED